MPHIPPSDIECLKRTVSLLGLVRGFGHVDLVPDHLICDKLLAAEVNALFTLLQGA